MSFSIGQRVKTIPQISSNGTATQPLYGIVVPQPGPGASDWYLKYFAEEYGQPVWVQFSTDGPLSENLIPYPVIIGMNGLEAA